MVDKLLRFVDLLFVVSPHILALSNAIKGNEDLLLFWVARGLFQPKETYICSQPSACL